MSKLGIDIKSSDPETVARGACMLIEQWHSKNGETPYTRDISVKHGIVTIELTPVLTDVRDMMKATVG